MKDNRSKLEEPMWKSSRTSFKSRGVIQQIVRDVSSTAKERCPSEGYSERGREKMTKTRNIPAQEF